jgi:hypothetical protein
LLRSFGDKKVVGIVFGIFRAPLRRNSSQSAAVQQCKQQHAHLVELEAHLCWRYSLGQNVSSPSETLESKLGEIAEISEYQVFCILPALLNTVSSHL